MLEILTLEVSVPLFHITLFVFLVSFCFLFERSSLGLLIAFVFVFYWASYVNRDILTEMLGENRVYPIAFYGGTVVLVILSGLGILSARRLSK